MCNPCRDAVSWRHTHTHTHTGSIRPDLVLTRGKKNTRKMLVWRAWAPAADSEPKNVCRIVCKMCNRARARSRLWSLNLKCDDSENVRTPCLILQIHYTPKWFICNYVSNDIVGSCFIARLFFAVSSLLVALHLFSHVIDMMTVCLLLHPFRIFLIY